MQLDVLICIMGWYDKDLAWQFAFAVGVQRAALKVEIGCIPHIICSASLNLHVWCIHRWLYATIMIEMLHPTNIFQMNNLHIVFTAGAFFSNCSFYAVIQIFSHWNFSHFIKEINSYVSAWTGVLSEACLLCA